VHWSLKARRATSWASAVPWAVFLNDVLPYAALTEPRDPCPNRIKGFIFLSFTVLATQVMLVVKKKRPLTPDVGG
jgi:hypothetical protein